jgi:hypothetical protein
VQGWHTESVAARTGVESVHENIVTQSINEWEKFHPAINAIEALYQLS